MPEVSGRLWKLRAPRRLESKSPFFCRANQVVFIAHRTRNKA